MPTITDVYGVLAGFEGGSALPIRRFRNHRDSTSILLTHPESFDEILLGMGAYYEFVEEKK
jgi:hypothetical protein